MIRMVVVLLAVLLIAVPTAMTGRGGGNFYVPMLVAVGTPMHEAATTGQLILVFTSVTAMLVFHKYGHVDWKLALIIEPPTTLMALVGGYFSHCVSGTSLKLILTGLLVLAGFCMLLKVSERPLSPKKHVGFWHREFASNAYVVNLWLVIPITAVVGLAAGAVGISGGSFKVPLMVLACGVPMRIAVGTSSAMVAATALMGFLGHTAGGDFNMGYALPAACAGAVGGLIGGKLAMKTKSRNLKKWFAYTTLVAAVFMGGNALLTQ